MLHILYVCNCIVCSHFDVNAQDEEKQTALLCAIKMQKFSKAEVLLDEDMKAGEYTYVHS